MNKILITTNTLSGGGMERAALNYAIQLDKEGYKIVFFTLSSDEVVYDVPKTIELHHGKKNVKDRYLFPISLLKLRLFCKKFKPSYVFCFSGRISCYVIMALWGIKTNVIPFHRDNPYKTYGKFNDWLNRKLFPKCKALIVQTKKAKEVFSEKYDNKNIIIVPNPVRELNIHNNIPKEPIVLSISRLVTGKGLEKLIEMFAKKAPPEWRLQIVGDGPLKQKLQYIAQYHSIENKVEFTGFHKDIDTFLSKASIFAFTSESEGFPNALLEAMCAGLACISFDCIAGPNEMIVDGVNGFLVEMGNYDKYEDNLERLMNDDSLRDKFSKEAKKLMDKYKMDKVIKNFMDDIKKI